MSHFFKFSEPKVTLNRPNGQPALANNTNTTRLYQINASKMLIRYIEDSHYARSLQKKSDQQLTQQQYADVLVIKSGLTHQKNTKGHPKHRNNLLNEANIGAGHNNDLASQKDLDSQSEKGEPIIPVTVNAHLSQKEILPTAQLQNASLSSRLQRYQPMQAKRSRIPIDTNQSPYDEKWILSQIDRKIKQKIYQTNHQNVRQVTPSKQLNTEVSINEAQNEADTTEVDEPYSETKIINNKKRNRKQRRSEGSGGMKQSQMPTSLSITEKIKAMPTDFNKDYGAVESSNQSHQLQQNQSVMTILPSASLSHNHLHDSLSQIPQISPISKNRQPRHPRKLHTHQSPLLPQISTQSHRGPMFPRTISDLKDVACQSFCVVDADTERLMVAHKASIMLEIASLTKIMTFYTVYCIAQSFKVDLNKQTHQCDGSVIDISGTSAQLEEGQIYTIQQLLYGLMLPSGNDASMALSEWAGEFICPEETDSKAKTKQFVTEMNANSQRLQLKNTRFGNPHGLPHNDSGSTALDMARLCIICLKIPLFRKVVSCKEHRCLVPNIRDSKKRQVVWENTNKLLRRQGFIGVKTGITVTAGPCLASAYQIAGRTLISIVLAAPKLSRRFKQTRKILHWVLTRMNLNLNETEAKQLTDLRKNKPMLDSDNSEEEGQFKFGNTDRIEYERRCKILSYDI